MAIEKIRLVLTVTTPDNVLNMISAIKEYEHFHPELSTDVMTNDDGGEPYVADHIYEAYLSRIEHLIHEYDIHIKPTYVKDMDLETVEKNIAAAEAVCDKNVAIATTISTLHKDDKIALENLQSYPLDELDEGFITFKFGRMPLNSFQKLTLYHSEEFVFTELHRNKHNAWIIYVCLKSKEEHFAEFFESMYFEPITIPESREKTLAFDFAGLLNETYGYVKEQAEREAFYKYISVYNGQTTMTGFVSEGNLEAFDQLFDDRVKTYDFPPEIQKEILAPTALKNNWFSYPFEMLVEMYGLPKYGEYDPTRYFAITYSLLFGMMFGDVGQGLVIVLVGYLLAKKKDMMLGRIMFRLGFFSMFFGIIYGSVFGNEELLTPFLKPLGLPIHVASPDFTSNLLISTVGIGVVLILGSILINIIVSLKHKRYTRALFSQNGLAGLMFYGFMMAWIVTMTLGYSIMNPLTIIVFIVIPLLSILFHEPLSNLIAKMKVTPQEGWGGYIVEGFFELFEVLLGFVTNTLSFLRVGGFILSHAGMMSVVMVLKDMSGGAGFIVFIIGNIIVIGLEGLIVGIQTLRLQYYEMFSRYYDGGGKPFKSVN